MQVEESDYAVLDPTTQASVGGAARAQISARRQSLGKRADSLAFSCARMLAEPHLFVEQFGNDERRDVARLAREARAASEDIVTITAASTEGDSVAEQVYCRLLRSLRALPYEALFHQLWAMVRLRNSGCQLGADWKNFSVRTVSEDFVYIVADAGLDVAEIRPACQRLFSTNRMVQRLKATGSVPEPLEPAEAGRRNLAGWPAPSDIVQSLLDLRRDPTLRKQTTSELSAVVRAPEGNDEATNSSFLQKIGLGALHLRSFCEVSTLPEAYMALEFLGDLLRDSRSALKDDLLEPSAETYLRSVNVDTIYFPETLATRCIALQPLVPHLPPFEQPLADLSMRIDDAVNQSQASGLWAMRVAQIFFHQADLRSLHGELKVLEHSMHGAWAQSSARLAEFLPRQLPETFGQDCKKNKRKQRGPKLLAGHLPAADQVEAYPPLAVRPPLPTRDIGRQAKATEPVCWAEVPGQLVVSSYVDPWRSVSLPTGLSAVEAHRRLLAEVDPGTFASPAHGAAYDAARSLAYHLAKHAPPGMYMETYLDGARRAFEELWHHEVGRRIDDPNRWAAIVRRQPDEGIFGAWDRDSGRMLTYCDARVCPTERWSLSHRTRA